MSATLDQPVASACGHDGRALRHRAGADLLLRADRQDQGLSQRIFYFHVPLALTAYVAFGWGAWKALLHLWKRAEDADLESYVAIHQGVIFGSLVLLTGTIWAKISWGVWWVWGDDELVLFLVLFLFYCAYFMLRYSVEPGPSASQYVRRLRAVRRRADPDFDSRDPAFADVRHPAPGGLQSRQGPQMADSQFFTFCVAWAAMISFFATLYNSN